MKETLQNIEVNQRKVVVGIEKGTGKNKDNSLIVMHRGIIAKGKDRIRNIYGTAYLFIDEKEHESSVVFHEKNTEKSERR